MLLAFVNDGASVGNTTSWVSSWKTRRVMYKAMLCASPMRGYVVAKGVSVIARGREKSPEERTEDWRTRSRLDHVQIGTIM